MCCFLFPVFLKLLQSCPSIRYVRYVLACISHFFCFCSNLYYNKQVIQIDSLEPASSGCDPNLGVLSVTFSGVFSDFHSAYQKVTWKKLADGKIMRKSLRTWDFNRFKVYPIYLNWWFRLVVFQILGLPRRSPLPFIRASQEILNHQLVWHNRSCPKKPRLARSRSTITQHSPKASKTATEAFNVYVRFRRLEPKFVRLNFETEVFF